MSQFHSNEGIFAIMVVVVVLLALFLARQALHHSSHTPELFF
jgi:hypothetical protein